MANCWRRTATYCAFYYHVHPLSEYESKKIRSTKKTFLCRSYFFANSFLSMFFTCLELLDELLIRAKRNYKRCGKICLARTDAPMLCPVCADLSSSQHFCIVCDKECTGTKFEGKLCKTCVTRKVGMTQIVTNVRTFVSSVEIPLREPINEKDFCVQIVDLERHRTIVVGWYFECNCTIPRSNSIITHCNLKTGLYFGIYDLHYVSYHIKTEGEELSSL